MIAALLLLLAQPDDAAKALEATTVAEEPAEPDDDCIDPQAQQQMNFCAARDFAAADAALNEEWLLTVAAMKESDAEIDREYDDQPGYYQTLLEGQRAWLRFRDEQCLLESYEARGGSMQPMLHAFCMTYLTEQRIQQLRLLTAGPEQ